jgi:hypothetical protein
MRPYEKEVKEIIEAMYDRLDEAIKECGDKLFQASAGKTYEDLSRALKVCNPVFQGARCRIVCYNELLKHVKARQTNEVIK